MAPFLLQSATGKACSSCHSFLCNIDRHMNHVFRLFLESHILNNIEIVELLQTVVEGMVGGKLPSTVGGPVREYCFHRRDVAMRSVILTRSHRKARLRGRPIMQADSRVSSCPQWKEPTQCHE